MALWGLEFSGDAFFGADDLFGADDELGRMLDALEAKCSICFEGAADTVLPACGDQFCMECVCAYWRGRLQDGAWGVAAVALDCPVCRAALGGRAVLGVLPRPPSPGLARLVAALDGPGRALARACPRCGREETVVPPGPGVCADDELSLSDLFDPGPCRRLADALRALPKPADHWAVRRLLAHTHCVPRERAELADIALAAVAACAHLACGACGTRFCFRCGAKGWHAPAACAPRDACPRCCVAVCRDADGACNETRCARCAHVFCWECGAPWGDAACGFYACRRRGSAPPAGAPPARSPEAGVPDVGRVFAAATRIL